MKKTWWELASGDGDDKATDEAIAKALDADVTRIEESPGEADRRRNIIVDLELYYGCALGSLHDVSLGSYDTGSRPWDVDEMIIDRVIYACVGAVLNWVCSFNPRADFVPSSGDYKLFRGAKDLRQACDAWMEQDRIYEERAFMFRDIMTCDAGVMKVYQDGTKITAERVPPWEILVDESDGRYRRPEVKFHAPWMPLEAAIAKYGDGTEATEALIRQGAKSNVQSISYSQGHSLVRVVDAYRQKWQDSEGTEHDGRHVIMVGGLIKLNEPWKWYGHPFPTKRFDWRALGYWGISGIHSVRGAQIAMNSEMASMEEAHEMTSQQVATQHEDDPPLQASNATVRIYKWRTHEPTITNPPAVAAERYKWRETLRDIVYETWGVPRNLAQGMKQPGLNSGIAVRESVEIKSDRISQLTKINDEIICEVADWWRKLSNELPEAEFQVMDRGMMKSVKTPKLGDNVAVRVLPSSLFGASVSGRIDKAFDLVERGVLTQEDALRAADVPDLEPITNLKMAEQNLREQTVDDILQDNRTEWPPEYMDPTAMHVYAKNRYFAALVSGVKFPKENLESLMKLIDAEGARAKAATEKASAASVTVPAPPSGMAPPGGGGLPPPAGAPPMDPALMPAPSAGVPTAPPMPMPPPGTGEPPAPLQ